MNDDKQVGSTSLIDSSTTNAVLLNFLSSPKPPGIGPLESCLVALLMLRKAEDHPVFDSQQTLAQMFGVSQRTIVRAQQELERIGWLSRPQRRGRTNSLSLNHENIPAEEPLRVKVTPQAGRLVIAYQTILQRMGRKRFPKHWLSQQKLSAQRMIDRCGGDGGLAVRILGHALGSPLHKKKSMKSLYDVLSRWHKITKTYYEQVELEQAQKTEVAA